MACTIQISVKGEKFQPAMELMTPEGKLCVFFQGSKNAGHQLLQVTRGTMGLSHEPGNNLHLHWSLVEVHSW